MGLESFDTSQPIFCEIGLILQGLSEFQTSINSSLNSNGKTIFTTFSSLLTNKNEKLISKYFLFSYFYFYFFLSLQFVFTL